MPAEIFTVRVLLVFSFFGGEGVKVVEEGVRDEAKGDFGSVVFVGSAEVTEVGDGAEAPLAGDKGVLAFLDAEDDGVEESALRDPVGELVKAGGVEGATLAVGEDYDFGQFNQVHSVLSITTKKVVVPMKLIPDTASFIIFLR